MPIAPTRYLLQEAGRMGIAVGAFSVASLEMIRGAVLAAEEANTPIILQVAEVRLPDSPLALLGPAMLAAAKESKVDVAVHLDHGKTAPVIRQALRLNFSSVMYDGSRLPLEENIQKTKEMRLLARLFYRDIEAELGVVGGSEDGSEQLAAGCTDPAQCQRFCEEAGVDALAIAIGNAHGNYQAAPKLRFDVLKEIARRVETPLVLHGGTGLTRQDFQTAIRLGIRKVNIATATFDQAFLAAKQAADQAQKPDYFALNRAMTQAAYENVRQHIAVFNLEEETNGAASPVE